MKILIGFCWCIFFHCMRVFAQDTRGSESNTAGIVGFGVVLSILVITIFLVLFLCTCYGFCKFHNRGLDNQDRNSSVAPNVVPLQSPTVQLQNTRPSPSYTKSLSFPTALSQLPQPHHAQTLLSPLPSTVHLGQLPSPSTYLEPSQHPSSTYKQPSAGLSKFHGVSHDVEPARQQPVNIVISDAPEPTLTTSPYTLRLSLSQQDLSQPGMGSAAFITDKFFISPAARQLSRTLRGKGTRGQPPPQAASEGSSKRSAPLTTRGKGNTLRAPSSAGSVTNDSSLITLQASKQDTTQSLYSTEV